MGGVEGLEEDGDTVGDTDGLAVGDSDGKEVCEAFGRLLVLLYPLPSCHSIFYDGFCYSSTLYDDEDAMRSD